MTAKVSILKKFTATHDNKKKKKEQKTGSKHFFKYNVICTLLAVHQPDMSYWRHIFKQNYKGICLQRRIQYRADISTA